MASSIDPTKPTEGTALTSEVRDNFQAAKDEIEALQTGKTAVADLADTTDVAKGDALLGVKKTNTGAIATTQHAINESRFVDVKADFGAVGDGVTDDTTAIQNAIDSLTNGGIVFFPLGKYLITSTLIDNGKTIILQGAGCNEDTVGSGQATIIQSSGAITAIKFNGNRSGARDLRVSGDNGAADAVSHGVWARSSRGQWKNLVIDNHRGDGLHVTLGNLSSYENIVALSNGQHGVNVDGTGEGSPNDANACTFLNIDSRVNGGIGFRTGTSSTFSNFVYGLTSQGNTSYGVEVNGDYYKFYGLYMEANDSGSTPAYDLHFGTNADFNEVYGWFSNYPEVPDATSGVYLDDSTNGKNYVQGITFHATTLIGDVLRLGNVSGGIAGYIEFDGDDGTQPKISLEGTSGTQSIKITSSGAGELGIDPDFITTESWTAPSLQNSWVDFGGSRQTAGYWKDKEGNVHVRGVIKSGTTTNPTLLFTLPAGYRPTARERFATVSNGAFASVFIDSDGSFYFESGSNVEFSICGITFRTD